ncbi:hypothetical protein [uncultured Tenacibaculum sp.]|uniref:hypothetical protein n=1 Tax=uncultured Tenacibaculum sp. TaxID=174713 RepID=UPI0026053C75|nr:hypothetical protein [uncultured Tenacibaculum sp.]
MQDQNKIIYSKEKSIIDTFIKVVKDKANFTITKDDSEENIIIPSNIREYVNTITYIFRESTLDSFKEYLMSEINSNLSKENVQFFNELNNTPNKILNRKIINWLGVIYNHKLESRLNNLFSLTQATNYNNVSYGDILSIIRYIEKTRLFSEKETPYFLTYLSNFYSIRLSETLNNNLLNYYESDFYFLVNGQLTNEQIKYFPYENNSKPRDYFKIYKSPQEIYELISNLNIQENKEELYLWLTFFFDRLGDDKDYTIIDDEIKKRTINRPGSTFKSVTFNAISFLYNILFLKNTIRTYVPNTITNKVSDSILYIEMEEWKNSLQTDNDYFQIFNIALFNKLINAIYKRAITKDSLSHFSTYLYEYIFNGIPEVINELNEEYQFNFEKLFENPFFKYWSENKLVLNQILDLLFEDSTKEKFKSKNNYIIDNTNLKMINRFIYRSLPYLNKTRLTILLNKLQKSNNPPNQAFFDEAWRIKNQITNNNIQEKKAEIQNLLNNLKSNG